MMIFVVHLFARMTAKTECLQGLPRQALSRHGPRFPPDSTYKINGIRLAHILQPMHHVRRGEDHSARPHPLKCPVIVEFDRPLAHQHELRVPVLMRGMRHMAWQQRSLMQLDSLARRKHTMHYGPRLPIRAVRHRQTLKRINLLHKKYGLRLRTWSGSRARRNRRCLAISRPGRSHSRDGG